MTQYFPNRSDRLKSVQIKEFALFKLIEEGASEQKIIVAAEAVRKARIRAVEAGDPSDGPRPSDRNIYDKHINMVRALPITAILAYFGYHLPSCKTD